MTGVWRRTARLWLVLSIMLLVLAGCQRAGVPRTVEQVPRMAASVLFERLNSVDDILVVDARSLEAYQEAHIPGAISVPYDEVASRLDELPQDQDIVFY